MPNLSHNAEVRLWLLNLSALLTSMLLGAVVGPVMEPFVWLLACRPVAASLLALLPSTRWGVYRPYILLSALLCLGLAQIAEPRSALLYLAVVALFLITDPSLDALMVAHSPEGEWLGRTALLAVARTGGLLLGLLGGSSLLTHPTWGKAWLSLPLASLLALFTLVAEQAPLPPGWRKPRRARFLEAARCWASKEIALSHLIVLVLALIAGSVGTVLFPSPMLSTTVLDRWLTDPLAWLGASVVWALLALMLERLSLPTLVVACYPVLLALLIANLQAPSRGGLTLSLHLACGLSLLVAYRHCLVSSAATQPSLRAAIPSALWAFGLLGGAALQASLSSRLTLGLQSVGVAAILIAIAWMAQRYRASVRITSSEIVDSATERRARAQGRHGDKKFDFVAVPEVSRKKRSRWLARIWYFVTIRFPVTVTLAFLSALLLAGTWQVSDHKAAWKESTRGVLTALKTELFLTSLKRRLEEEMLASNRVPTDWADFIARNFRLDGRPMKDRDFWGSQLEFEVLPKQVKIVSAGPDKKLSTSDDIERTVKRPDGVR